MRTQKQQQHLFRFRLGLYCFLIAVYLKSIFAYPMESESKLLARFFAVLFSTASYPGPDALSLVLLLRRMHFV